MPRTGREKRERIDLGLAVFSLHAIPGICYTREEIALWCGCTDGAILLIEQKALRKIREFLQFRNKDLHSEIFAEFFERRSVAVSTSHSGRFS